MDKKQHLLEEEKKTNLSPVGVKKKKPKFHCEIIKGEIIKVLLYQYLNLQV